MLPFLWGVMQSETTVKQVCNVRNDLPGQLPQEYVSNVIINRGLFALRSKCV